MKFLVGDFVKVSKPDHINDVTPYVEHALVIEYDGGDYGLILLPPKSSPYKEWWFSEEELTLSHRDPELALKIINEVQLLEDKEYEE